MAVVLEVKEAVKIYESRNSMTVNALNGIDLSVEEGEFLGIMGPSGSGKTTLLNVISGIDRATSGIVKIKGENIYNMSKDKMALFRREHLGFVFQDFNLLDSLTVKENIALPMTFREKSNARDINRRVSEITRLLQIFNIQSKYPYQISGGQQQLTAIGRALVNNPVVIFADEPTGNLDSKSATMVLSYLEKINRDEKRTIVMVTHDAYAASFCSRIIFIADGKIRSELTGENDKNKFHKKYLMRSLR